MDMDAAFTGQPGGLQARPAGDFDAIVLGAGISGLVAAAILRDQGCRRILVADEYERVGGNHIDVALGDYSFDVGSFIFQDDSPLLRHFPDLLSQYVPIDPSWGRLNPQGAVTPYPLSVKTDLIDAGPVEWARIAASLVLARLFRRRMRNAREFAEYWVGPRFMHRSGLGNYMERFYGSAPEEIDIHFAEKRMLWIREHALLRTHLQRFFSRAADRGPSNVQLARPKAGFAALYQPAVDRLRAGGVTFALGARPTRLSRDGERFILEVGEAAFTCGRVVSTIPLDHIRRLCGLGGEPQLDTVTLVTLFYSFAGERGFPQSILYNFSDGGAWKRLTVYSDFYGAAQGREYFAAELNARHVGACAEAGDRDFHAHVAQNGLFDGDLRLEGSHVLDHAYPIYLGGAQARLGETLAELRRFGIESIGRQGAFDYQPTARDTTLKAEAALDWKR